MMTDGTRCPKPLRRSATTWSRMSSSRPVVVSAPPTCTAGCSRTTSSSCRHRSTTRSPASSRAQLISPRVGEPRQGHQHLHQQPRWRHHGVIRNLRHDAVHQERHRDDLPRPGSFGRRCAARRWHKGQAARAAHSRVLLHQPSGQVGYGQVTDLELAANEILRMREILDGILARHTGQPIERIHARYRP